jgi:hypothetical protein
MKILRVTYNELIGHPEKQASRINQFLDGRLDVESMVMAVDPGLYRNRRNRCKPSASR